MEIGRVLVEEEYDTELASWVCSLASGGRKQTVSGSGNTGSWWDDSVSGNRDVGWDVGSSDWDGVAGDLKGLEDWWGNVESVSCLLQQ